MLFYNTNKNLKDFQNLGIKMNSIPIERVNEFNLLGITLDERLNWKPHINKISFKLARINGILARLKHTFPTDILRLLYNSLFLPYLNYGVIIWGRNQPRITKLQKRAVRLINKSKYNSHTEPIYKNMKLLKFDDIFKLNCLKLFFKHINLKLPSYFLNYKLISYNTNSTRQIGNIMLPRCKKSLSKNKLNYKIASLIKKICLQ